MTRPEAHDEPFHPEVSPQEWADLVDSLVGPAPGQWATGLIDARDAVMHGEPLERAAWWATLVGAAALVVIAWKMRR